MHILRNDCENFEPLFLNFSYTQGQSAMANTKIKAVNLLMVSA